MEMLENVVRTKNDYNPKQLKMTRKLCFLLFYGDSAKTRNNYNYNCHAIVTIIYPLYAPTAYLVKIMRI